MKIEIKEPCHADWSLMTPTEQGKFCSSCEKEVVDFTKMSKIEIQSYFKSNCDDSICGRFQKTQLETKSTLFSKIKYVAVVALGVFLPTSCMMGKSANSSDETLTGDTVYSGNDSIKVEAKDTTQKPDYLMGEIAPPDKIKDSAITKQIDKKPIDKDIVSGMVIMPEKAEK